MIIAKSGLTVARQGFLFTLATLLLLLLSCPMGEAQGQQLLPAPGHDMPVPGRTVVTGEDPLSITENPALTGFIPSPALSYQFVTDGGSQGNRDLTGHGLFVGGRLFSGVGLAMGLQFLNAPLVSHSYRKWTMGGTISDGKQISGGITYNMLAWDQDPALDHLTSWDLSLAWQVNRYLAAGGVIRDLGAPEDGWSNPGPLYDLGLAIRPFPNWLTISGDVRLGTGSYTVKQVRGLVQVEAAPGIGVGAQAIYHPDIRQVDGAAVIHLGLPHLGIHGGAIARAPTMGSPGVNLTYAGGATVTSTPKPSLVKRRARTVELAINGDLPEHTGGSMLGSKSPSLPEVLVLLNKIRDDREVKRVLLTISSGDLSLGQAYELRSALGEIRDRGKEVIAYLEMGGNGEYFLASAANQIYLEPTAHINLVGLHATLAYYGEGLEKLGLGADFVISGKYKDSPESLTGTSPSRSRLEVTNSLLDHTNMVLTSETAPMRGLTETELEALIDKGPFGAREARENNLIDGVAGLSALHREAARDSLLITLEEYGDDGAQTPAWGAPGKIALINVSGTIVQGESTRLPLGGDPVTGAATVARALVQAAGDPSVKGIVVRINSGGGGVTGASIIGEHIKLAAEKKPVVVSMGRVAASGGYWAASQGSSILATPVTLTGSIGVFGGKIYGEELIKKLGITQTVLKRGERSDLFSLTRPFTREERVKMGEMIDESYELFLDQVAEGRGMDRDLVHKYGQGRVWTGTQALKNGLIDKLGTLSDAIEEVRQMAGLEPGVPVELTELPRAPLLNTVVGELMGKEQLLPGGSGGWVTHRRSVGKKMMEVILPVPGSVTEAMVTGHLNPDELLSVMPVQINIQ